MLKPSIRTTTTRSERRVVRRRKGASAARSSTRFTNRASWSVATSPTKLSASEQLICLSGCSCDSCQFVRRMKTNWRMKRSGYTSKLSVCVCNRSLLYCLNWNSAAEICCFYVTSRVEWFGFCCRQHQCLGKRMKTLIPPFVLPQPTQKITLRRSSLPSILCACSNSR